jgi:hypothetical protein
VIAPVSHPRNYGAIYRTTLRKIVRHRYNVFRGRTSLPTLQKVLIALRVFGHIWLETTLSSIVNLHQRTRYEHVQ